MKTNIELFTITKHRNPLDLKEWVDYHLAIGFDKITIYDNESTFSIQDFLASYENVEVIYSPGDFGHRGYQNQTSLATSFFMRKKKETKWLIWMDDDEFLYSKNNVRIDSLLNDNLKAISFFWKFMSSPNIVEKREGTLINTFNYFSLQTPFGNEAHVKTIINMEKFSNIHFPTAHIPILDQNSMESTAADGGRITMESDSISSVHFYDIQPIIIYHYYYQSWEDWLYKCYKGSKDKNDPYRSVDRKEFEKHTIGKYIVRDDSMIMRKKELGIE